MDKLVLDACSLIFVTFAQYCYHMLCDLYVDYNHFAVTIHPLINEGSIPLTTICVALMCMLRNVYQLPALMLYCVCHIYHSISLLRERVKGEGGRGAEEGKE